MERIQRVDSTRSHSLRKVFTPATHWSAEHIDRALPNVTANQLTVAAGIMTVIGNELGQRDKRKELRTFSTGKIIGLVFSVVGNAVDGIDGTVAHIKKVKGRKKAKLNGKNVDSGIDRCTELAAQYADARTAHILGDPLAEFVAYSAALTTPIPGLLRALVEAQGRKVPEVDFGSRIARVGVATINTFTPEINGKNVTTTITNGLLTAANLYTIKNRAKEVVNFSGPQVLTEEQRKGAQSQIPMHLTINAINLGILYMVGRHYWKQFKNNLDNPLSAL